MRTYLILATVVVACVAGCGRSEGDVRSRFETAIHQRDQGWQTVVWDDRKYDFAYYQAQLNYKGEVGVHHFLVSAMDDRGIVVVDEKPDFVDERQLTWQLFFIHFDGDRPDAKNPPVSHCSSRAEEEQIKALAVQLNDALYHAVH